MKRWVDSVQFIVYYALALYFVAFVFRHPSLVMGRYTDAWWHSLVAEEYAVTGVFAKDPFIAVAPSFAPFGLLDVLVTKASIMFSVDCRTALVWVLAILVFVFMGSAFLAGYRLRRKILDGCICGGVCVVSFGYNGVIGLGLPFFVSSSLFALFWAFMMWGDVGEDDGNWCGGYANTGFLGALWRGLLLGLIFDLHAFSGLVATLFAAFVILMSLVMQYWVDVVAGVRRELIKGILFGVGFLVLAWPWVILHFGLREVLARQNAHSYGGGTPPLGLMLLGGVLLVIITAGLGDSVARKKLLPFMLWGVTLLVLCIPVLNRFLAGATSSFMSERVPYLFPYGLVAVLVWAVLTPIPRGKWKRFLIMALLACASCILLVFGAKMALGQVYLTRTHDYDQHPWQYLDSLLKLNLRGKTILSDPFTSYYARGYLGTYAVTVPRGHASPALNYRERDELAKRGLSKGVELAGVSAILIDRVHTPQFAEVPEGVILKAWMGLGWDVAIETERVIVLLKPETRHHSSP